MDIPFHRTLYGRNEPVTRTLRLFNVNSVHFNINDSKHIVKRKLYDTAVYLNDY